MFRELALYSGSLVFGVSTSLLFINFPGSIPIFVNDIKNKIVTWNQFNGNQWF